MIRGRTSQERSIYQKRLEVTLASILKETSGRAFGILSARPNPVATDPIAVQIDLERLASSSCLKRSWLTISPIDRGLAPGSRTTNPERIFFILGRKKNSEEGFHAMIARTSVLFGQDAVLLGFCNGQADILVTRTSASAPRGSLRHAGYVSGETLGDVLSDWRGQQARLIGIEPMAMPVARP